jgi:fructose-specific phosphotransferase system IIA component
VLPQFPVEQDQIMRLTDIIKVDCVRVPLESLDKQGVLFELVDLLSDAGRIGEPEALKEAVWEREVTRTTGIGYGLAIPHGKSESCDRLVMAVGKPAEPIDFNAIDGQPVSVIFLLASPPDQTGAHIQALARVSRLMTDSSFREKVMAAEDSESLFGLISEHDGAEE